MHWEDGMILKLNLRYQTGHERENVDLSVDKTDNGQGFQNIKTSSRYLTLQGNNDNGFNPALRYSLDFPHQSHSHEPGA